MALTDADAKVISEVVKEMKELLKSITTIVTIKAKIESWITALSALVQGEE